MKVFDLSHTIAPGMTVYPGTEAPQILDTSTVQQDGFAEKKIILHSHNGTHIDAPAHIFENREHLDDLSIDHFCGRAFCLAVSTPVIDCSFLQPMIRDLQNIDFLLLNTGWSKFWGEDSYLRGYPILSENAAKLLCGCGLKGVGFDTLSADRENSGELPIHRILLDKMIIVENLSNLGLLPEPQLFFSCLPLKIAKADGSPIRAVGIYP